MISRAIPRLLLAAIIASAATTGHADWIFGVADFSTSEPLKNAPAIIAAGYDFIEPGLSKAVALPEAEFRTASDRIRADGIRVAAMNWFVPGSVKLTGPDVDPAKARDYAERALALAHGLGARAIVFGSPAARTVPDGFSPETAWAQLVDFCHTCADIIEKHGYAIRIGIEHLNRGETNIVNTLADALRMAREVNRPPIGVTLDFYHLMVEKEDVDLVLQAKGLVAHVQLADPDGRKFPYPDADIPGFQRFFENLRTIGYDGGISIEANVGSLDTDLPAGLAALKAAAAKCPKP